MPTTKEITIINLIEFKNIASPLQNYLTSPTALDLRVKLVQVDCMLSCTQKLSSDPGSEGVMPLPTFKSESQPGNAYPLLVQKHETVTANCSNVISLIPVLWNSCTKVWNNFSLPEYEEPETFPLLLLPPLPYQQERFLRK